MKERIRSAGVIFGLWVTLSFGAAAEIQLPHMLSDHAVLQRERPIHIWGQATPGESVKITFHEQKLQLIANDIGHFSGWLAPEKAGGPYVLTVSGSADSSSVTAGDILVGDVWFASGQSNMEMPLQGFPGQAVVKDAENEIANSSHADIRLIRFEHRASDFPMSNVSAVWRRCDPEAAREFSAVAYFFGRELAQQEHVPVGLIDSTWGGTPIDSWMSLDSLGDDASLMPVFASRARFIDDAADLEARIDREKQLDAEAKARHEAPPQHPWHPEERSWSPSLLYNGMVAPATSYTIRGFLWYQGETDSSLERSPMYSKLLPAMIRDWRERWGEGSLPFVYVQISSFDSPQEIWGAVRDAQRRTLSVANTAMAVSLDVGEAKNVHPPDKQTVGHRLALGARHLSYGEDLEWSGPLVREADGEGKGVRVWFDHAGGGLQTHGAVRGFELAGSDGHFLPAKGRIEGNSVSLACEGIPQPHRVRYAWANVSDGNLYNSQGLPAPTFLETVR